MLLNTAGGKGRILQGKATFCRKRTIVPKGTNIDKELLILTTHYLILIINHLLFHHLR